MELKKAKKNLDNDSEFLKWKKDHKNYFLVNAFVMLMERGDARDIQFGFCNKKGEKITSFIVKAEGVEMFEDKIFKRPESEVSELNIGDVEIGIDKAIDIAKEASEEHYPKDKPKKQMMVLQNSEGVQQWNMTFVTDTLSTLNFRIDAKEGNLMKHEKRSLLQLGSNLK